MVGDMDNEVVTVGANTAIAAVVRPTLSLSGFTWLDELANVDDDEPQFLKTRHCPFHCPLVQMEIVGHPFLAGPVGLKSRIGAV